MALSVYAALFGCAGAAVGVHAGTIVALRRGWIRGGSRFRAALTGMLVAGLAPTLALVMALWSRDAEATAGADVIYEAYFWMAIVAASIFGLGVCVETMRRGRRGA